MKETLWSKLTDTAGNILEHVDISRQGLELELGDVFDNGYSKGTVTEQVIKDILWYQTTKEGKGYYEAYQEGNKLFIKFLKRAF
jgi:hypothetical protein